MTTLKSSATTAPTQFVETNSIQYAYRQLGVASNPPLLCLQHFTGTLDNWDPLLIDALAERRQVILFESAGIGRSGGTTPDTVEAMAEHATRFLNALHLEQVDVLGFSLGGMVAQVIATKNPHLLRRLILAGTGPQGGEGTAMARPELLAVFTDEQMPMREKLMRLFFPQNASGQRAAKQFVDRLEQRTEDREPAATGSVAVAQLAAMSAWEKATPDARLLAGVKHPVLVTNGDNDIMIPTANSMRLSEQLPNAQLILYPNSGHGALFQYAQTFANHVTEFLDRSVEPS